MCTGNYPINLEASSFPRRAIGNQRMFFFYFNRLGCVGSIVVSVVLTLALVLIFRLFSG